MKDNPNQISSDILFQNPYWKYKLDKYKISNGNIVNYHYVSTFGSTIIIAKEGDKFIFTKQYRYLNNKVSLEFPGGGIVENLSPLENGKKELLEETGYFAENLEFIGNFNPFNGVTDEVCTILFTDNVSKQSQLLDDTEDIEIVMFTEDEIDGLIQDNIIWDGMTITCWFKFKLSKGKK